MLTTAPMATTKAAIARPLSSPLTAAALAGAGVGAFGFGAVEAAADVAGRAVVATVVAGLGAPGAADAGGRDAGALGAGVGGLNAEGGGGAPPAAKFGAAGTAGPPVGNVGNRIVAVGLGGKLMRTVSFFG